MNVLSKTVSKTREMAIFNKIILSFVFVGIYALFSKVRFYFPWTEVPFTMQTTAILSAPFFLGWFSIFSILVYFILGISGVAVFSGNSAGFSYIFGPTAGYLIGFIFATIILNRFLYKKENWEFKNIFFILLFVDLVFILLPGSIWYGIWQGKFNFFLILRNAVLPFIPGDLIKIVIPVSVFSHFARDEKN